MAWMIVLALQDADKLLEDANALMEQEKYAEALATYEPCLKAAPDREAALYNGGLSAYLSGKVERAAELWEKLRAKTPEDRQLLAKLVQAYSALKKTEKRDETRKALFEARAKLPEAERDKAPSYCREQFECAKKKVMVFEYFELKGERALRHPPSPCC